MPPRRSARVAGVAEREREARSARVVAAAQQAAPALAPLPLALVLHILSLLPVDARLRCAEVCRSWRAALEERSLWIRLDLSASGVSPKREATDALLRAAAARARGELVALDLRSAYQISDQALLAVLAANAGALRELRVCAAGLALSGSRDLSAPQIYDLEALLRAAPQLSTCDADLVCESVADAHSALRNEALFRPLRLHQLVVTRSAVAGEAALCALAADLALHASLEGLTLRGALLGTAAALDAVVAAALACRLTSLHLTDCNLSPASVPALVRVLGGGTLTDLFLEGEPRQLLDEPAAELLGAALRGCTTLTSLSMRAVHLWEVPAAAVMLLGALTGHPSLRALDLWLNHAPPPDVAEHEVGAAMGALVAANAPALQQLSVAFCFLHDTGLRPLFDALPSNTHLRKLNCSRNELSDAFVRDSLLPAVRANSSLRELQMALQSDEALEAQALVQRRAADEAAAEGGAALC
jgi:hypothetical protein